MPVDSVTAVNDQIVNSLVNINWGQIGFYIALGTLLIGACIWAMTAQKNKKVYNKVVTAFEIVNGFWQPVIRDKAKSVKLGSGGFEILYLKKAKTWKIAYGGRVGKDTYYFFIMPDGYWYNGMLSANLSYLDKNKGLIEITTTNPLMRGQYTSLEKQVESLHGNKTSVWDKYGSWILGISFVMIAGVMLWLCFREFSGAMGQLNGFNANMNTMLERVNTLISNTNSINTNTGNLVHP
jgi:hypothetical protein